MKFLEILLSFIASQGKAIFQSNAENLSYQIVNNIRRIAILLTITVISISLFCIGFSMGYSGAVISYESFGIWTWSPRVVAGFTLIAISGLGLLYSLGESRWLAATDAEKTTQKTEKSSLNPVLEGAIAVIITELASELKERRRNAPATPNESSRETPQI